MTPQEPASLVHRQDAGVALRLYRSVSGSYAWELSATDPDSDSLLAKIESIDQQLRQTYGAAPEKVAARTGPPERTDQSLRGGTRRAAKTSALEGI